jgi:hypothetical protein
VVGRRLAALIRSLWRPQRSRNLVRWAADEMGSSFTSFHDHGFWTRDASLELWLYLLAAEVQGLEAPPAWLRKAADDWTTQATVGMTGCVSAGLDHYGSTPDRIAILVSLAEATLASLRARGTVLSSAWLNSLGLGGPGSYFTADVPADPFLRAGETFIRLLQGEITWTASSAPLI